LACSTCTSYSHHPRNILLESNHVSMIQVLLSISTRLAQISKSHFCSKILKTFKDPKFKGREMHERR
jgi:hypothetical protein